MHAKTEPASLRPVLRDLVALSSVSAGWIGKEPPAVATGLADALVELLQLDFAFVRLSDPGGTGAVDVTRGSARWPGFSDWLEGHLATSAPTRQKEIVADVGAGSELTCGVVIPVGFNGDGGVVAAACRRRDFPTAIDELFLSLAANHAATAFQSARLSHERARAEDALRQTRNELEVKVTERTAQLGELADEQAALLRMATLVAEGVPPAEIFSAISEEVGHLFGSDTAAVVRFENNPPAIVVVGVGRSVPGIVVGTRSELDDGLASSEVYRTGRSARLDSRDWASIGGPFHEPGRRLRLSSTVASPIAVEGRLWGTMTVSGTEPFPLDTEERLERFSNVLATAIANAESREALGRLADEQAALRRVATLVAQGAAAADLFTVVCEEVGQLLPVDSAAMGRYDPDGMFTTVAAWSKGAVAFPVGRRWTPVGRNVTTMVFESGRPARLDDFSDASGPVGIAAREAGYRSAVGTPIVVEGCLWGVMTAASSDQPLPQDTEARLASFTELVATAIANAEGREELQASRARIVAASDEARRRIERDLHDGMQQRLVTLGLAARAAEATVARDSSEVRAMLSRIATGLGQAVEELQELSRGIHPAIIADAGLGPALEALQLRSAIPVVLDLTTDARLPEPIEVAAYYVASEALANAAKHAHASRIDISLALHDNTLLLSIRDDGNGGADPARGSGLIGLTDRVEAVGGTIQIDSRTGHGTHITAELPLQQQQAKMPPDARR